MVPQVTTLPTDQTNDGSIQNGDEKKQSSPLTPTDDDNGYPSDEEKGFAIRPSFQSDDTNYERDLASGPRLLPPSPFQAHSGIPIAPPTPRRSNFFSNLSVPFQANNAQSPPNCLSESTAATSGVSHSFTSRGTDAPSTVGTYSGTYDEEETRDDGVSQATTNDFTTATTMDHDFTANAPECLAMLCSGVKTESHTTNDSILESESTAKSLLDSIGTENDDYDEEDDYDCEGTTFSSN